MTDDATNTATITNDKNVAIVDKMKSLYEVLDAAQQEHGVHSTQNNYSSDYQHYQDYCRNRVHRIRHHRECRHLLTHNHKLISSQAPHAAAEKQFLASAAAGSKAATTSMKKHSYCPRLYEKLETPATANSLVVEEEEDQEGAGEDQQDKQKEEAAPAVLSLEHENVIWNIVLQAERCWAQACTIQQHQQRRQQSSSEAETSLMMNPSSNRNKSFHSQIQRRLNKAVKYAGQVEAIVTKLVEQREQEGNPQLARLLQECTAYAAWMKGNATLEHAASASAAAADPYYVEAYRQYRVAYLTLMRLAAAQPADGGTDGGAPSAAAVVGPPIWSKYAESVILPVLRFCQYKSLGKLSVDELSLDVGGGGRTSTSDNDSSDKIVIRFLRYDISLLQLAEPISVLYLKMEPQLRRCLAMVTTQAANDNKEEDEKDDENAETVFLDVISDVGDMIHLIDQQLMASTTTTKNELRALRTYFHYQKLLIQRHQQEQRLSSLLSTTTNATGKTEGAAATTSQANRLSDLIHHYTMLQQTVQEMMDLFVSDDDDDADNMDAEYDLQDDDMYLETQAHALRIRALRCAALCEYYYEHGIDDVAGDDVQQQTQLVALLQHTQKLAAQAYEEMSACDSGEQEYYLSQIQQLTDATLPQIECRILATRYLLLKQRQQDTETTSAMLWKKTQRPLWLRMHDYDIGQTVASLLQSRNKDDDAVIDESTIISSFVSHGGDGAANDVIQPIPMPCKPAFYDLAYSYVVDHGRDDDDDDDAASRDKELSPPMRTIQEYIDQHDTKQKKSSGGILGWFSSK